MMLPECLAPFQRIGHLEQFSLVCYSRLSEWFNEVSKAKQVLTWSLCLFSREKNSQASKVFISTDLCGQKFLCFLVESQLQLR